MPRFRNPVYNPWKINIAPESEEQEGDVVISQTGYQMILLATNEVNVDINDFNTNLKQNDPNYFCVEKKQDYTIVPNSCHIFEQEQYTYQMKNPLTLRIAIYTAISSRQERVFQNCTNVTKFYFCEPYPLKV